MRRRKKHRIPSAHIHTDWHVLKQKKNELLYYSSCDIVHSVSIVVNLLLLFFFRFVLCIIAFRLNLFLQSVSQWLFFFSLIVTVPPYTLTHSFIHPTINWLVFVRVVSVNMYAFFSKFWFSFHFTHRYQCCFFTKKFICHTHAYVHILARVHRISSRFTLFPLIFADFLYVMCYRFMLQRFISVWIIISCKLSGATHRKNNNTICRQQEKIAQSHDIKMKSNHTLTDTNT